MTAFYPIIMLTSLAVGLWLSRRTQSSLPLTVGQRWGLAAGAFVGAMLGAKLPFALADARGPICLQAWISDGKTIVFGLVGGYLGVEIAKALLEIRVKTGDSFAIPAAVSIGIGRFGCLVGGCCYGSPTGLPWGWNFGDGIPRHPTQLYEAGFHFAAAGMLWGLRRRGMFPRQLFKLYLLAYFGYRFATEFLRPEVKLWGGLTGYQWASLALIPVILLLWRQDRRPVAAPDSNRPA